MKFFVIFLVLLIGVIIPLSGIAYSVKELNQSGKQLLAAVKQENLDQAKPALIATRNSVKKLNLSLGFLMWMKIVPFLSGYYSDIQHFGKAAEYELQGAEIVVNSLEPYKQELGLVGQSTAGQDRVAQAVKILDKILPEMDKIEPSLKKAKTEVENIDTNKYPESFKSKKIKNNLELAKNLIIGADVAVTQGKEAVMQAPKALGQESPKTYLLLFQNDKELRPTGGFITAYAFLKLDKGHLSTTNSDDIYRLDEQLLKVCENKICPLTPPAPLVKYLPELNGKVRSAWSMRDSNLSPDLPTSAADFEKMYQMLTDKQAFDGIITIDTQVVEELIKLTGPIDIFGTTYSAGTDKRCNCPNVIFELENYAEVVSKGEADRKAIVGALMQQIMAKVLGTGPEKMLDFLGAGVTLANDKHIMFYMHDPKLEQALSNLNWTGEVNKQAVDYLYINDANFAGGKSNLYVDEKVTIDINIDSSGNVKNKVVIDYKNPQAFNIWLNGILRDYVRLYAPAGAKLANSKGSDDSITSQNDEKLNKTYFEAFITVRPQNSRTLSFEYTLPNKITDKNYSLLIQKQPGAKDHHYVVKINGSKKAEFDLKTDKQLNLSF